MKRSIETTCIEDTARTYVAGQNGGGTKIPWWVWFFGPYVIFGTVFAGFAVAFVLWVDAERDEQYRAYIAKYQCVETAIETPPGHTYFRYVCNNGYQFTLGRKP